MGADKKKDQPLAKGEGGTHEEEKPTEVKKSNTMNMALDYLEAKRKPFPVVVHPIVLLSVVDHYNRSAKGTSKRVIGTLLGEVREDKLHITSSFAVPFEEEPRDPNVWFLDHNYHEDLAAMFKKVNAKEKIVGWYSTGGAKAGEKIKPADLMIHDLYRGYCAEPVLVIIDVKLDQQIAGSGSALGDDKSKALSPHSSQFPMEAYYSVSEKTYDGVFTKTFKSLSASFGADEAEDVGTEHLLRDLKNASTSTLATHVETKVSAVRTLISKLKEVAAYLDLVQKKPDQYPYNAAVIGSLQDLFNELPESCLAAAVGVAADEGVDGKGVSEDAKSCMVETNDHYLNVYVGGLLRSILTLHNLVKNKIGNRETAEKEAAEEEAKEAEREKKAEKERVEKERKEEEKGEEKK